MERGMTINLNEDTICPDCGNVLKFEWENSHGDRKIALCCDKEYSIMPSSSYVLEDIMIFPNGNKMMGRESIFESKNAKPVQNTIIYEECVYSPL